MAGLQQTPLQMMKGMMVIGDDASQFIMPPADSGSPPSKPWWKKLTGKLTGGASSSGCAAQESLQLLAMPATWSGYIYRVVLWLEEAPGPGPGSQSRSSRDSAATGDKMDVGTSDLVAPGSALHGEAVRPADRLALGSFRVERGRSSVPGFGPEVAFLEANRLCPLQGLDVESRGLQCIELSPPLPVLRGQHVGLVNVEGGSLGTGSQLKNWLMGDGEKGFWCGSLDTDGITAATCPVQLSCGSELSSRFRRRTSWMAGMSMVVPAAPSQERRAKEQQKKRADIIIRDATPKESQEKVRLLTLEPPISEEIILEGPGNIFEKDGGVPDKKKAPDKKKTSEKKK